MGRAPCCDKANVKKGPWSPEEDSKLKEYMEKYGTGGNWIALPQKAGLKRCGKSCRLRWLNYLRPNIKHGEFSDEEDRIICTLFSSIGSRWSIIAAQLPGRTDNDIKNYWNTKLKKKLMALAPQTQRKSLPFPSPNPTLSSPMSILSLYKDSAFSGSYSYFPTTGFDPISPNLNFPSNNNNSNSSSSSLFQIAQETGVFNPMQYYHQNQVKENQNFIVFGSDQASCSSNSDGSYNRENKQEEMGLQSFISNGYEENPKFMLSYGNGGENLNQGNGYFGELIEKTPLEYDLEDVKQLITTTAANNNNNNMGIDENKTQEKLMYYYYC